MLGASLVSPFQGSIPRRSCFPGRRCALPWADMFGPLRGEFWGGSFGASCAPPVQFTALPSGLGHRGRVRASSPPRRTTEANPPNTHARAHLSRPDGTECTSRIRDPAPARRDWAIFGRPFGTNRGWWSNRRSSSAVSTCMIINRSPTVAALMGIPNSAIRDPQSAIV